MKSTLLCLKFEVYSLFQSFYFLHNIQTLPVKAHFLNLACNISSWQTKVYALLAIIYTCTLSTNLHHRKSNLSIREITALITKHLHLIAVTILSPPPSPFPSVYSNWPSTLQRTRETGESITYQKIQCSCLLQSIDVKHQSLLTKSYQQTCQPMHIPICRYMY